MKLFPLMPNIQKPLINRIFLFSAIFAGVLLSACSSAINSCDDLEGIVTHTVTEITGIKSASVLKRNSTTGVSEAVDQFNGTEFSNLSIEIVSSWVAEQHRFSAPTTLIQSLSNWLISPAMACTLAPYYEEYQPGISNISIYSDNDFNTDLVAGLDLSAAFAAIGLMGSSGSLIDASKNSSLLSAREYSLQPAWQDDILVATPATPNIHVFTVTITLSDGHAYSIRTPEVLLSGI